ncbi:Scr1 family TA system antitoxin-like transcriptional regulator [Nocardia fluminea]|uniref:Scr1 family TA system antitoxin-like transcriptional regulator n=1 Tax=Nocardia fluminea TaxID=134984 RepID=UPI000C7147AB|nr:Scr1 family TA system antitoxin-like transcriptional regulator [Nocardia fluminea]
MANTSWHDITDGGQDVLQRSLILRESDTNNQRSYNTKLLPELLQTHDYARAFFDRCSAVLAMTDDSEELALARLQRQTALDMPGYDFHMLIDEAALRITVGSSEVMTTQIRHLMNILTARAHVRIGIIALSAEFLSPADSFDFSYATDSDDKRITDPCEDADVVELVERTFDLLATTAVYGEEAHAILVRALASHTESGI